MIHTIDGCWIGSSLGISNCYMTVVVICNLDCPLSGYTCCGGLKVGRDFFEGMKVVTWKR